MVRLRQATAPAARGHEMVLLLDDDPTQRRLLRLLLERQGVHVEEVARQDEALARLRHRADRPTLVLADHRLADGTGLRFFEQLNRTHPGAAFTCVLLSATRHGIRPEHLAQAGVSRFVEKPMRLAHYEQALQEVLHDWRHPASKGP